MINNIGPAYEINESYEIQETDPAKLIERHLRMKYECLSISEYLEKYFLQTSDLFEMKALPNGYIIFKFNDKSNPLSLGFVLNKDRIMSYGCYVNDKLHGFGCKFESNVRY